MNLKVSKTLNRFNSYDSGMRGFMEIAKLLDFGFSVFDRFFDCGTCRVNYNRTFEWFQTRFFRLSLFFRDNWIMLRDLSLNMGDRFNLKRDCLAAILYNNRSNIINDNVGDNLIVASCIGFLFEHFIGMDFDKWEFIGLYMENEFIIEFIKNIHVIFFLSMRHSPRAVSTFLWLFYLVNSVGIDFQDDCMISARRPNSIFIPSRFSKPIGLFRHVVFEGTIVNHRSMFGTVYVRPVRNKLLYFMKNMMVTSQYLTRRIFTNVVSHLVTKRSDVFMQFIYVSSLAHHELISRLCCFRCQYGLASILFDIIDTPNMSLFGESLVDLMILDRLYELRDDEDVYFFILQLVNEPWRTDTLVCEYDEISPISFCVDSMVSYRIVAQDLFRHSLMLESMDGKRSIPHPNGVGEWNRYYYRENGLLYELSYLKVEDNVFSYQFYLGHYQTYPIKKSIAIRDFSWYFGPGDFSFSCS